MFTKVDNKAVLNEKIEKLIEQVELAGSWIRPFKKAISGGMPKNFSTGANYKGANIFFLWLEAIDKNYSSNEWLTMKQCNLLKGKILKGSKATPIFFFKPIEIKEEKDGEEIEKTIPMLKVFYVFNIEQTTLKNENKDEVFNNNSTIDLCEDFFASLNFIDIKKDTKPFYSCTDDFIGIPDINSFISSEEYYATLSHELIHSTGHKTRLDRDMSQKSYAYEELIAELGSAFVSAYLGIDKEPIQDNCKAYLKGWLKSFKDDKKYLWKAMGEASKAFDFLIDEAEIKHFKNVA